MFVTSLPNDSYWISPFLSLLSMALCDSRSGSHWLSLPLSGILWPSLAHYCSLISRIQPLIGSQGPCSVLIADATMTHFVLLCYLLITNSAGNVGYFPSIICTRYFQVSCQCCLLNRNKTSIVRYFEFA